MLEVGITQVIRERKIEKASQLVYYTLFRAGVNIGREREELFQKERSWKEYIINSNKSNSYKRLFM